MKKIISLLQRCSKDKLYWFVCIYTFLSLCIRYIWYGVQYFYLLDDYLQYFAYPSVPSKWDLVLDLGLLASRPLAGVFDIYVWGHFFGHMILGVFVISALYAISAVLFLKVFAKQFKTGVMFVVFYALLPFFFEAAYWMSASTRVVVGLFFISVSVYALQCFLEKRKWYTLVLFALFQLVSYCMYEQILVLSVTLSIFVIYLYWLREKSKKTALVALIPFINAAIYFVITYFGGKTTDSSALQSRMSLVFPSFTQWYYNYLWSVVDQLRTAFLDVCASIAVKGFFRGLYLTVIDRLWYVIPISCVLAVIIYFFCRQDRMYRKATDMALPPVKGAPTGSRTAGFFMGVLLALAPISVFFVLGNPYFSMRNVLPVYVGLSILFDMAFSGLARKHNVVMCVLAGILVFNCNISTVSELHDYQSVYDFDMKISAQATKVATENPKSTRIACLIQAEDKGSLNAVYHEHGRGSVCCQWALRSLISYQTGDEVDIANLFPIEYLGNEYRQRWNRDETILTGFDKIYYWDNAQGIFVPVTLSKVSPGIYALMDGDRRAARVIECEDNGYIYFDVTH